jgi:hypothetical protein
VQTSEKDRRMKLPPQRSLERRSSPPVFGMVNQRLTPAFPNSPKLHLAAISRRGAGA